MDGTDDRSNDWAPGQFGDWAQSEPGSGIAQYKPKGGLPAFKLVGSHMVRAGGDIMEAMREMEDGDVIPEEHSTYFDQLFPFTIGDVILLRIPRGRQYTLDPSPCDPHRVIISYNTNIEVTLFVTKFLMESRRFYCGEPWFVNGHHKVVFEAPVLRDALLVHIICDSSIREHI